MAEKELFKEWLSNEFINQKLSIELFKLPEFNNKLKGEKLVDSLNEIRNFIIDNKVKELLQGAVSEAKKADVDITSSKANADKFDKNVGKLYACDFVKDSSKISDPMAISRCAKILGNLIKYMGGCLSSHPISVLEAKVMSFAGVHEKALSRLAVSIKSVIAVAGNNKKTLDKAISDFADKLYDCQSYFSNKTKYEELWGSNGLCMTVDILEDGGMENFVKLLGMAKNLDGPKGSAAWVKCQKRLKTAYEKFSEKK